MSMLSPEHCGGRAGELSNAGSKGFQIRATEEWGQGRELAEEQTQVLRALDNRPSSRHS